MKSLFILLIATTFSGLVAAQTVDVPNTVRQKYNEQIAAPDATWRIEAGNYVAAYADQGKNKYAVFTAEGNWVQTETIVPSTEVSAATQDAVQNRFLTNNYQLVEYLKISNGTETFEGVHLTTGSNHIKIFFDGTGKIKKRVVF